MELKVNIFSLILALSLCRVAVATSKECWVRVDDTEYDVSSIVEGHLRFDFDLNSLCKKDGTQEWKTKGSQNRGHSKKAQILLKKLPQRRPSKS